jgi:Transposase DDE domain.
MSEKVINKCKEYNWDYIIRYKKGSAPSIAEEYDAIPEKETCQNAEFINDIIYKDSTVNVLKYKETKIKKGKEITTTFEWITSFKITNKNAEKLANAGRKRWKIENQGFNRQKQWQGNIEHACSYNANAQKCHYLMEQIVDFIKQLYEYYFLEKNDIKKLQKNISSDLLASFTQALTREDILRDMHCISNN